MVSFFSFPPSFPTIISSLTKTTTLVKAAPVEDDEEEELRKLRAEMAINV